jgi:hypothetical protein
MDWLEALRARLLGDAPLVALLPDYTPAGQSARKTVFWDERPQAAPLTSLVLSGASSSRPQHLKGFDLASDRLQFDAYAATPKVARGIAEAAITAVIGPFSQAGHQFQRAEIVIGPRAIPERLGDKTIFRVSMDLNFHHAISEEVS